ncbi:MAG TPA: major capsid protein [Aquihabitans sp.]|jgi:hypothetical protein|nr:major capsid protein [Aquihabitans sp.]
MAEILEGLDPVELTNFARLEANDFDAQSQSLARWFPYQAVNDIRYAYSRGVDVLLDEAQFRSFDAESPLGRRPGASRVTGELQPISRKIPLSEYAQLRIRNASNDEINDQVFNDAARLARGIAARFERARGELLRTGNLVINENGVVQTYSSGRHASLTVGAVSPLWSAHSTATPIQDILDWMELIRAQSGVTGNRLLVSRSVMSHLQQIDEVRGAFMPAGQVPNRITTDAVGAAFVQLAGVTVEVLEPPAGMTTPPIPANTVILLQDGVPLGTTTYGIPVEATLPEYQGLAPQPGVLAGGWKDRDPVTAWTHAVAIGLPLLGAPNLTLSATVLA